jgi:hypothetical protein
MAMNQPVVVAVVLGVAARVEIRVAVGLYRWVGVRIRRHHRIVSAQTFRGEV